MLNIVRSLYLPNPAGSAELQTVNRKIKSLYLLLAAVNLGVWAWALITLNGNAALLGTALLAYSFGLRHALDVDHIAAIDNVTRRLMHHGQKPVSVGFFFALGHSMVVVGASLAIALMAKSVSPYLAAFQEVGGMLGNIVSNFFLLAIGLINGILLFDIFRKLEGTGKPGETGHTHFAGGVLARILRPLTGNIQFSWQMIPLGILFGLGFETATEVAVLSTSAIQASQGASLLVILLFPFLFTAGMSTVDATDGVLMLRVYGWAFIKPQRKMFYNMILTLTSTALAFIIAGINIADMVQERYQLEGGLWNVIHFLHESYTLLGSIIVGIFILSWAISQAIYRHQASRLAVDGH